MLFKRNKVAASTWATAAVAHVVSNAIHKYKSCIQIETLRIHLEERQRVRKLVALTNLPLTCTECTSEPSDERDRTTTVGCD